MARTAQETAGTERALQGPTLTPAAVVVDAPNNSSNAASGVARDLRSGAKNWRMRENMTNEAAKGWSRSIALGYLY